MLSIPIAGLMKLYKEFFEITLLCIKGRFLKNPAGLVLVQFHQSGYICLTRGIALIICYIARTHLYDEPIIFLILLSIQPA
jgi:hypothetical protein